MDGSYNLHPNKKPKWRLMNAMESQITRNDFFISPSDFYVELISFGTPQKGFNIPFPVQFHVIDSHAF